MSKVMERKEYEMNIKDILTKLDKTIRMNEVLPRKKHVSDSDVRNLIEFARDALALLSKYESGVLGDVEFRNKEFKEKWGL